MPGKSSKIAITPNERLQLIGLLALAQMYNKMLKDIERAAFALTGELDNDGKAADYGHTSDAIYSDYSVDDLLGRLDLTVMEQPAEP